MYSLVTPIDNVRAELHQIVHRLGDQLLIARNWCCRDDNCITRHNRDLTVIRCCHARKRRHRLPLTARRHNDDLLRAEIVDLINADDRALRCIQITELKGDADDILHTASEDGDTAFVFDRRVNDLLDAMHI